MILRLFGRTPGYYTICRNAKEKHMERFISMNTLTTPLAVAFLFAAGCVLGWCLEFLFRNLISHNGPRGKYFINPGFCKGPCLPIYGIGLSVMCLISTAVTSYMDEDFVYSVGGIVLVILVLGLTMILIEFIGGLILLKVFNIRLWDYRDMPGNFMGIVCPQFSLIWTLISAVYYIFIHSIAIEKLVWFSENLAFSFFVGLFFGIFIIDLVVSARDALRIRNFGREHDVVVQYEKLKGMVQSKLKEAEGKNHFFNQVAQHGETIAQNIEKNMESVEKKAEMFKSKRRKKNK